ncbi:hypothetical protein OC861_000610 [Tilletia horrida]|nr:hypothetical protein OC845_000782 [Tilletia horrida]KAK0569773.1 hypothetical protein OC861_000610 [Tilletia horrida]
MKVPSQTPVILAALSVAGSLAANVDSIAVDSAPDNASQLTADQRESLDSLTKGLNGAGAPTGDPLAGIPAGASTAGLSSATGYSPETIAALVQQNQQLLGMLSAYLPSQAASPASGSYGMVQGMLPSQFAGQVMQQYGGMPAMYPGMVAGQLQQLQQGGLPIGGLPTGSFPSGLAAGGQAKNGLPTGGLPTTSNLNGLPAFPMNLPSNFAQPWHLADQPPAPVASAATAADSALSSATNTTTGQLPLPLASATTAVDPALSSVKNMTASLVPAPVASVAAGADPALTSAKNMTSGIASTLPVEPNSASNVTAKANKLANDVAFGQLAQNIPLPQGQSIVNGVASNAALPQDLTGSQAASVLSGAAGTAGSQLGQAVPVSQVMNGPAGAAYGQVSQLQPFQQASGTVKGVTNGQLGQGLPLDQATGIMNGVSGGMLGSGGAGGLGQGLLGKLLGPMSLQQKPEGKDKNHKPVPSVAAPSPLADASALVPGGPSAALNVPQGALPNKLNLQQKPEGKDKSHKPVPSVAAPSPLADASALVPGGPSAALSVPQGIVPNKLKDESATTDSTSSDIGDTSATGSDFGSAPGDAMTVDTSTAESTPAPRPKKAKGQHTAVSQPTPTASDATDEDDVTFATATPAPKKIATKKKPASQPTAPADDATTSDGTPSVSDDDVTDEGSDSGSQPAATQSSRPKPNKPARTPNSRHAADASSADADQTDDQASLRPQSRAWTWIAPRSDQIAGRFVARDLRRDAAADLLSAKGSVDIPANPLINSPAPVASNAPAKSSKSGPGKSRMEYKKTKSAPKSKEQTDYDNAREALIKAEASMWEAEHPQGIDKPKFVGDNSDDDDGAALVLDNLDDQSTDDGSDNTGKKGMAKKPKSNNPLWAWIGGNSVTATVHAGDDDTKSSPTTTKGKKGKKTTTMASATSTAATLVAASFKFPASMTGLLKAGAPDTTPGPAASAPIRPPVKVGMYTV